MKTIVHRNTRHFICALAISILLALNSGCIYVHNSDADLKATATRTRDGEIPATLKSLEVENRFGDMQVVAAENEPARWSWKLTIRARTDQLAQELADAVTCSAVQDGDHLKLVVSWPDTREPRSIESDLELRVPKAVAVRTKNGFGRTAISGVTGEVDVTAQHGGVELKELPGKIRAQTSFASLNAANTGAAELKNQHGGIEALHVAGPLEAETSFATLTARDIGGKVTARNQHGRIDVSDAVGAADLKTSFAELRVQKVQGDAVLANQHGRVNAQEIGGSVKAGTSFASLDLDSTGMNLECRNQHGSIHVRALSAELATLDAQTSFGSIEVHLPAGLKPAVQARTTFADIDSDFPVLLKPRGQDAFADVEAGAPRVKVLNEHGSIRILRDKSIAER